MWPKGKTINDAVVIGEQEGGLYKLKGHPEQALVHDIVEPNEIFYTPEWHLSVRVPTSLMLAHKRTPMDRGLPKTL